MIDIFIRNAVSADIPLLAQISKKTFYETFKDNHESPENFEKYVADAFSKSKIQSEFEEATTSFLLAENKEKAAVAYAKLRWDNRRNELMTNKNYMEIERIYVAKAYLRMGIGKLMMSEMFDIARQRGFEQICLSVYENNLPAIRFYEQLDFQTIGKVTFKMGDVVEYDILMVKNV